MTETPFNSINDYYVALVAQMELGRLRFSELQKKLSTMGDKKREKEFHKFMEEERAEWQKLDKRKPKQKRGIFSVNGKLCFRGDDKWVEIPKRFQENQLNDPEIYFFGKPIPVKKCANCHDIIPTKLFLYRKYCSEQCQGEAKLKRKREKYQKDNPPQIRVCEVCKKIIEGRSDKQVCGKSSCQKAFYRKNGRTRKKES